ncbi:bll7162 [alpha proteobacterium U9-1i]|nr:bll7162 [alpha proteobacterium U9-1i]
MPRFVAVYTGTPESHAASGWDQLDEATRKAREAKGMQAWMDWGAKYKDKIVVHGGPLGKTKSVGKDGVRDIRNNLAGYIVVEAASHEEAAAMFENHPHFAIFPGESVEVMPELPIPTLS